MMGEKIELKNWKKFRGGLDVKADLTGSTFPFPRLLSPFSPLSFLSLSPHPPRILPLICISYVSL